MENKNKNHIHIFSAFFSLAIIIGVVSGLFLYQKTFFGKDIFAKTGSSDSFDTSSSGSGSTLDSGTSGTFSDTQKSAETTQTTSGGTSPTDSSAQGSTGTTGTQTTQTGGVSASMPAIEITAPQGGATLAGAVRLEAKTSSPVESIIFYFDNPDSLIFPDRKYIAQSVGDFLTWQYFLDSRELSNGKYSVGTVAQLQSVSYQGLFPISVTVSNSSPEIFFTLIQPASQTLSGKIQLLAQTSVLAESAVFEISGPVFSKYPASIDGKYLSALWDTTIFPNGEYRVTVHALRQNQWYKSAPYVLYAKNSFSGAPVQSEPAPSQNPLPESTEATSSKIQIIPPEEAILKDTVVLKANASSEVRDVIFVLEGAGIFRRIEGEYREGIWQGKLDTRALPNGSYALFTKALVSGNVVQGKSILISVKNEEPAAAPRARVVILRPLVNQTVDGAFSLQVAVEEKNAERVFLKIRGAEKEWVFENFTYDPVENVWRGFWNTKEAPNGWYELEAVARISDSAFSSEKIPILVNNFGQEKPSLLPLYKEDVPVLEQEFQSEEKSPEPEKKRLFEIPKKGQLPDERSERELPQPLREKIPEDTCEALGLKGTECTFYLAENAHVSFECAERNIFRPELCKEYENLPRECQFEGIVNSEACRRFLFSRYSDSLREAPFSAPLECKGVGNEKCDAILQKKYFPKECSEAGIRTMDKCKEFIAKRMLPPECIFQNKESYTECNEVIRERYFREDCERQKILEDEPCLEYIFERYASKIECRDLDNISCKEIVRRRHLASSARAVKENEKIQEIMAPFINSTIILKPEPFPEVSTPSIENITGIEDIIPVKVFSDTGVLLLPSQKTFTLFPDEKIVSTASAVLVYDSDQDGLPDDIEVRLGTSPEVPDSDGDGYSDGDEVSQGFDPLGTGAIKKELEPMEEAIVKREVLEHAKVSGDVDENFQVVRVENVTEPAAVNEDKSDEVHTFQKLSGRAFPNQSIMVYIYSDVPLVVLTRTDEFGNWTYTLQAPLREGEHEVYVTVNDNTGKIVKKSEPYHFFVKEARAVTASEFFVSGLSAKSSVWDNIKLYLLVAGAASFLGIVLVIFFLLHGKHRY